MSEYQDPETLEKVKRDLIHQLGLNPVTVDDIFIVLGRNGYNVIDEKDTEKPKEISIDFSVNVGDIDDKFEVFRMLGGVVEICLSKGLNPSISTYEV